MRRTPAETARAWRSRNVPDPSESDLAIGLAASFTVEPIEAHFGMAMIDHGWVSPTLRFADYNQLHQLCLDPVGVLGSTVDHIVALWRIEDVFADQLDRFLEGDDDARTAIIEGSVELAGMFVQLANGPTGVTVGTPPLPQPWGVDLRDSRVSLRLGLLHRQVAAAWLSGLAESARVSIVDLDTLVRLHGARTAVDDTKWALYRQPFSSAFWSALGSAVADVAARQYRPAPKCIVLDCDNTLWGGIIGEDGLAGIELGDVFPGSAFRTFQQRLRQYRESGVMLAVASKNDAVTVREVFEKHDGMALSFDDIACWKVNWSPKSGNIKEIAEELNIGLDSLVFVDDSPYELAEVESAVPEVRRVLVPEEVAELPALIADSGLFRHLRVSAEDRHRTQMMLAENARKVEQADMTGEDFLQSLELVVEFFAPREEHVARIAQLTNKTNQFNLTTIRRSEAEMAALMESSTHEVRTIRVRDRFGDYGVVGVAVVETDPLTWTIESFLMSCRVLGRGVDSAFLAALIEDARSAGATVVRGRYVGTPKNGQVADFYPRHGFSDDGDEFRVDVVDALPAPGHIAVAR
jgi:FkbH-like protein